MPTFRVEAIVVLALLVALLLQLPRVDDPPELRLVGGEITRVEDIGGAALYVDTGSGGIVLVYVSELRMHQDASGTAYVTKLDGTLLGPDGALERLRIDVTGRAFALGWVPVMYLDSLVSPGNDKERHAFEFRRLRFRRAIYRGRDVLLVVGRVEGLDLVTGHVVSEEYDEDAACPAIPFLECVRVFNASGGSEYFWALTGTVCWRDGREPTQPGLPAWTAGHRSNGPAV